MKMTDVIKNVPEKQQEQLSNNVDPKAVDALKSMMKQKEEDLVDKYLLENMLKENIQKEMSKFFSTLSKEQVKDLYEKANTDQERAALVLLFDEYKAQNLIEKEKQKEFQAVIKEIQKELRYFRGQILEQGAYGNRSKIDTVTTVSGENVENRTQAPSPEKTSISEEEMKQIDKYLNGKMLESGSLNAVEKRLKSDFSKMINLLGAGFSFKKIITTLNEQQKAKVINVDWNKLFSKKDAQWSEKELKRLNNGYQSYLESKLGNPQLGRWNTIINRIESSFLNEGMEIADLIQDFELHKPISKKEWKNGLKTEEADFRGSLEADGQKDAWIQKYREEHQDEIQGLMRAWSEEGIKGTALSNRVKEYLQDQFDNYTKKEWKKHLKDQKDLGIQKSDLGKFHSIVEQNKNAEVEDRILALMTDTNFDGQRNAIDGKGVKRGLQVDQAFLMAKNSGLDLNTIITNIKGFMAKRGMKPEGNTPEEFYAWLSADIKNAKMMQQALMDSPVAALDIMRDGANALKNSIERQFSKEDYKKIAEKVDTDPSTKDLSAAARESLKSSLSGYLLAHMRNLPPNATINGLGIGVGIPLEQVLKGLSFSVGLGTTLEGGQFVGVSIAWNTEVAKWETGQITAGVSAGTTLGVIPIYGFRAGIEQDINAKKVLGSLDPNSLKTLSAGANLTMLGPIPSWGLNVGFDSDKLKGIEKQYANIKKSATELMEGLLKTDKSSDAIKAYLKSKFEKTSAEALNKAAQNLEQVLKLVDGEVKPELAAVVIGEWYAESWRNNAIQGLPKGWRVTGGGIGIQFLAGVMPLGTLSLTLTKYKNEHYEDSPESRARLQQKIDRGIGNIDGGKIDKSHIKAINDHLMAANILKKGEEIEMEDDGSLLVPTPLLDKNGLYVMIDPALKGTINFITKGIPSKFYLPAGLSYRFLKEARTNGSTMVFNIGGAKNDGMERLTSSNFKEYLGERNYLQENLGKNLTASLDALKNNNPELANVNAKIENGNVEFFNGEQKIGPFELGKPMNYSFKLENGGIFHIKQELTDGISIERRGGKPGEFQLSFEKPGYDKEVNLQTDTPLLQKLRDGNSELVKGLSKLDDKKLTALNNFLKNAKGTEVNYQKAATELLTIIPDQPLYEDVRKALQIVSNPQLLGIGTAEVNHYAVNVVNDMVRAQYMVIDRIKAIFATELGIKDINSLRYIVDARNNVYKTLKGPNGQGIDSLGIDSKAFAREIENINQELVPGLIGFTAFYRKGTNEGRGLSLTGMGETKVLGNKMKILTGDQEKFAKNRFFGENGSSGNLEKYATQQAHLYQKIREMVPGVNLKNEYIKDLIQGKQLDIGEKMVKLDSEFVFYLMGECANESLGMNIKGIKVIDKITANSTLEGTMTWNLGETIAKADIEAQKMNVGFSFGGKKAGEKKEEGKTQGGSAEKTQGGSNRQQKGSVENAQNVGDHYEGNIPTGTNVSPKNPVDVDTPSSNSGKSTENPLKIH